MDVTEYRHSDSVVIARPPEDVYDLVADVSRMGRWSPVCTGGEYDTDDPSWFTGTNAVGTTTWQTRCHVVASDRGREFAFVSHGIEGRHQMVRWSFTFEAVPEGTAVTESWEVLPGYEQAFADEGEGAGSLTDRLDMMRGMAVDGIRRTLDELRQDAEAIPA